MRALFGGLILLCSARVQRAAFICWRTAGSLPVMEGAMFMEDVNILAESTATMKATLYSDAGYNTGVLAASSLGVCNAGVLRGRSQCDRSSVPMHRFGRSLLSVGRQRKSDRVGGLAPLPALCWRTTGSLPTTMKMEIAGVPGVFGTLLCRPWSLAGMDITMQ